MRKLAILAAALIAFAGAAAAQTPPSPVASSPSPPPYGAPIDLARAQKAISASIAEATRRGWTMSVVVVDSGTNLVALARMDGAQLAAVVISEHKARTAVAFRRPTRAFEEAARAGAAVLSLDGVIASAGGVPLIEDGKLIGAIGCSGGASTEDEATCLAGAATINGAAN